MSSETINQCLNVIVPVLGWSYPGFVTYLMVTQNVDHFLYKRTRKKLTKEEQEIHDRKRFFYKILFVTLCGPMAWGHWAGTTLPPYVVEIYKAIKEKFNAEQPSQ
jgi:hypothetical protein